MDPPSSSDLAASGMFLPPATAGSVLCCHCRAPIQRNEANTCERCLRSGITEGLPRDGSIVHCPDCVSYLIPPRTWVRADLESKELLSLCLRRLKILLPRVDLTHAEFVSTEPYSKRIKLKLRLQREVLTGVFLQESHLFELAVHDRLCYSCSCAKISPDQWTVLVQLRQRVPHRRTFLYLEQLLIRHGAAAHAVRIFEADGGLDLYFSSILYAAPIVVFIKSVAPVLTLPVSKRLVSHPHHPDCNIDNFKQFVSIEICPICREDLLCLPPAVSRAHGNLGPLVLCTKVKNTIQLIDPFTLRYSFLDPNEYRTTPFKPLLSSPQLVKYIVLDIEKEASEVSVAGSKYSLARAAVAQVSDLGNTLYIKTHLGHLLNPGDYAFGYDLHGANTNDREIDKYTCGYAAILVKKCYEEKRHKRNGKPRPWKLKRLNVEVDNNSKCRVYEENRDAEYEQFLKDLEENLELRIDISLYRNKEYQPSEVASMDGVDDIPFVPLSELLA